jgi:hypothetical protein
VVTALGICALLADIILKAGCSAIRDKNEPLPLECNILVVAVVYPVILANSLIALETVIFSYCRLYMIMPGIFKGVH